jgi:putative alpha-1,2-mannosidase
MSMMGLFPNPGQSVYLITVPFFESVSIVSPLTGNTATVRVANWSEFNSLNNTGGTGFIQSATLNGKPYTRNWVDHDFFTQGQDLVLVLSRNESAWGTRPGDLPPSLSDSTSSSVMGRSFGGFVDELDRLESPLVGGRRNHARHATHLNHHAQIITGPHWQKGW